jgi:hypothetical protein
MVEEDSQFWALRTDQADVNETCSKEELFELGDLGRGGSGSYRMKIGIYLPHILISRTSN